MLLSIGKASKMLGLTEQTLRVWEKEGKLKSIRTNGGHRRYEESEIKRCMGMQGLISQDDKKTIIYARVSTSNRKDDLERQKQVLEMYCVAKGWKYDIIEDIGSGLNYKKQGLLKLIELIETNQVKRIVLNYKDRLLRYGSEIIFEMCKYHDVDIEIINESDDKTYNEELVDDVLAIITVFSAKLYGSRSHKNKNIVDENKRLFKNE